MTTSSTPRTVVVLGASDEHARKWRIIQRKAPPYQRLGGRVQAGLSAAQQGSPVVITGLESEMAWAQAYAASLGVQIGRTPEVRNTAETVLCLRRVAAASSGGIVVVSHTWHLPRIWLLVRVHAPELLPHIALRGTWHGTDVPDLMREMRSWWRFFRHFHQNKHERPKLVSAVRSFLLRRPV